MSVILSAALRRRLPASGEGPQPYTLPAGATLADLLAAIGLDAATDVTAAVDGELAEPATPLLDGAEVMLLAPMEGGAAAEGEATMSNVFRSKAMPSEANQSSKTAAARRQR